MERKPFLCVRKPLGIFPCLTKVTYLENFLAFEIILHIDYMWCACDSCRKAKNIGRVPGLLYYIVQLISISLKMLNFSTFLAEWPYRKSVC